MININDSEIIIGTPVNATDRQGYDNQPAFTTDGDGFLYSSYREGDQTDIFYFNIADSKVHRVTSTPESEYSPTPLSNKNYFSTVRVEMDGTQRLWRFNIDGTSPKIILEEIINVGYHGWGNDNIVGLFIVGPPNTFILANSLTGHSDLIVENAGRSIHKVPSENAISFIHKLSDNEWWINKINLDNHFVSRIIRTLDGSEDYVWTPDGMILMAKGATIYKWNPLKDNTWIKIKTFEEHSLQNINRLALSPNSDYFLLVSDRPDKK